MPTLLVLPISDCCAAAWPTLAHECGLELEIVRDLDAFDRAACEERGGAVGVVAAGGVEHALEPVLRRLPRGVEVAAVGVDTSRHLATAAVRAGAAEYFALLEDYPLLRAWMRERAERLRGAGARAAAPSPPDGPASADFSANGRPAPGPLAQVIRAVVAETVAQCEGNKSEAARQLGISRTRLLRVLAGAHGRNGTHGSEYASDPIDRGAPPR